MLNKLMSTVAVACLSMTVSCNGMNNASKNIESGSLWKNPVASCAQLGAQTINDLLQNATNSNINNAIRGFYDNNVEDDDLMDKVLDILESYFRILVRETKKDYDEPQKLSEVENLLKLAKTQVQYVIMIMYPENHQAVLLSNNY